MPRFLSALTLALALAGLARAQNRQPSGLPAPRLYVVTPAGARAGSTVEITVGGFHLEDADKLVFSDPRLKAEPVAEPPPPIDPKTKMPMKGKARPVPTSAKFKVTVPADAPLGNHDVRVVNKWGVSNPRAFHVGDLKEADEVEPNNDLDAPNKPHRVELNSTVNASFNQPNDVDYFVFKAARGQRVVVSLLASTLDSRAQPAVELYDPRGRPLGENVFYDGDDAVIDVTAPDDGDYVARVYQFTHTFRQAIVGGLPPGTSDNQYRLSVSTAPWIDAVV
ncbi:MAG: PPC domain-containing protein, partial [Gemmataceae bacterium]